MCYTLHLHKSKSVGTKSPYKLTKTFVIQNVCVGKTFRNTLAHLHIGAGRRKGYEESTCTKTVHVCTPFICMWFGARARLSALAKLCATDSKHIEEKKMARVYTVFVQLINTLEFVLFGQNIKTYTHAQLYNKISAVGRQIRSVVLTDYG